MLQAAPEPVATQITFDRSSAFRSPNVLASNPVQQPEEQVQIVDEHNEPVRSASRKEMREQHLLHRCSFVITHNSEVRRDQPATTGSRTAADLASAGSNTCPEASAF